MCGGIARPRQRAATHVTPHAVVERQHTVGQTAQRDHAIDGIGELDRHHIVFGPSACSRAASVEIAPSASAYVSRRGLQPVIAALLGGSARASASGRRIGSAAEQIIERSAINVRALRVAQDHLASPSHHVSGK